jgi:hypothetical protein
MTVGATQVGGRLGESTTGGTAQDGAYARSTRDLAFPGSLRSREAVMAHWPKTISGNIFTIALAILVVPMLVWFLITLPIVFQLGLAAVALACVALAVWRHRVEAARERNWVGEFSFGDVVRRRHADEALEVAAH